MCQAIEPTESQYSDAKERYETIGAFLSEEGSPLHPYRPVIYPQGSMRIRAAIKPDNGKEYDVDLVCEFKVTPHSDPKIVKRLVWDRFRNSDRYRDKVIERNRCVQIQYAGEFHMDVMPCVPGLPHWLKFGSVWVPDQSMNEWKPSHPKGFAAFVETASLLNPVQSVAFCNAIENRAADVQPLPSEQSFTKPALIRIIQILKRHRDEYFRQDHGCAPISIILTTLATHSYSEAVKRLSFESAYDLLLEVVTGMPKFINVIQKTATYSVPNPTHSEENFAEKWNHNPLLPKAFFDWHRRVSADFKALAEQETVGLDAVGKTFENSFGVQAANRALRGLSSAVRSNVKAGNVGITATGLVVPATKVYPAVAKTPPHNFHGG